MSIINNFPNNFFNNTLGKFVEEKIKIKNTTKIYYEDQMSINTKLDENITKNINKQKTNALITINLI